MTRQELLQSPEYWTAQIQIDLFNKVEEYLTENNMTRTEFAQQLGVSKGYISQVLNGDFNHRLSQLVRLALAIGYQPKLELIPVDPSKMKTKIYETIYDISNSIDCTVFITENSQNKSIFIKNTDKYKPLTLVYA